MCGIAGFFSAEQVTPAGSLLQSMIATLRHRGPDQTAVHSEQHLGLAHARLSIVDLSPRANQPMSDVDRTCLITFNGEIYNYQEVRDELVGLGHRFASDSDTEVVLEGYKEWGDGCLDRLNGMWAFALWDRRQKRLLLSRDRFGVKPLFVHASSHRLLFASEIKALLAAGVMPEVNAQTLNAILSYAGGDRGSLSLFRGVEAVGPGECIAVTPLRPMQRWRWWRTTDHLVDVPRRAGQRVERFRELLFDAVRLRLRTDVATAISLSSGLDSSSIFAAWHELLGHGQARSATEHREVKLVPFVAAFPGYAIDESREATELARSFHEEPQCIEVAPADFRQRVEEVTWHQESLVWSAAVIAYHELYRKMAERGIRVVLEGHGSDEILGGYPQFGRVSVAAALRHFRLVRAWQAAVAVSRAQGPMLDEPVRSPAAVLLSVAGRRFSRALDQRLQLFDSDFLGPPEVLRSPDEASSLSPLKQSLYVAFHARILPGILRVFDRATMAHSIESRAPFLDWRLVTFAFSLPDSDLIGEGWTKRILRQAMRPYLPAATLWRRRKIGFALPHPEWFATPEVSRALRSALTDGTLDGVPGLRHAAYETALSEAEQRGFTWQNSGALWQAYSYGVWYDRFVRKAFRNQRVLDTMQCDG